MAGDIQNVQAGTSPGPNPYPKRRDPPGLGAEWRRRHAGDKAYYINLEAKPGKGDKVEQFLRDILAGVEQEPGTGPWFGCRFSDTTFGIFEAFPDTAARNAHDIGPGGRNFLRSDLLDEMLAYPAHLSARCHVWKIQRHVRKENYFELNASILETRWGSRSSHHAEAID